MITLPEAILQHARSLPEGGVLSPREFLHLGSRAAVDQAFSRLAKANELARGQGLDEGFRTIINTGRIGHQEVYHLHVHVLGGPEPLGSMLKRKAP